MFNSAFSRYHHGTGAELELWEE
uniref:Uncharacterized protein n=1 Tax=Arundo donax TaxID=35708 RepID=A0A0A9C499_ARUDO